MLLPCEHGTARGYIHFPPPRMVEAAEMKIRSKAVHHMLLLCLVDESVCDLLFEGPQKEIVYWSSHNDKEEAHVSQDRHHLDKFSHTIISVTTRMQSSLMNMGQPEAMFISLRPGR